MGVAIGLSSCQSSPCRNADEVLGTILYNGPFDPQYHENSLPPYENFTVRVPSDAVSGRSQINVAHAALIGVSTDHKMVGIEKYWLLSCRPVLPHSSSLLIGLSLLFEYAIRSRIRGCYLAGFVHLHCHSWCKLPYLCVVFERESFDMNVEMWLEGNLLMKIHILHSA